jgi:signal transduction histidine kinase
MWQQLSSRTRIFILLAVLLLISFAGGGSTIWYTYHIQHHLMAILDSHINAYRDAEALEIALVNQKGFVTYYFMDHNPDWLRQLGEHRQIFFQRLEKVRDRAADGEQRRIIEQIDTQFQRYVDSKNRAIEYFKNDEKEAGAALHAQARQRFFDLLNLCEAFKGIHTHLLAETQNQSMVKAQQLRIVTVTGIGSAALFSLMLVIVLVQEILRPLDRLAREATPTGQLQPTTDVVKTLRQSVHGLMEDISTIHSELEKSQEHLLQAEKMALVGSLAAGMAHSIRNPFTSVQMRLFSLRRTLDLDQTQKEDLDVISDEIRHIDTIVQNFLEFARPPRLQVQRTSSSAVVDSALQLLEHRLNSYHVSVAVERSPDLPEITADPEQLKEVLVNLMVNACEAMTDGGHIIISERQGRDDVIGPAVFIAVRDNGPGIEAGIQAKVFQPFFTTKEEGTGLGLSIVERIVSEHGGRMLLESKVGTGTQFTLVMPIK